MIEAPASPGELARTPDLLELAGAARDAGLEATVIERPMPDATSVVGIGRRWDIVSAPGGAVVEDDRGRRVDEEAHPNPLVAGARLWRRLAQRLDPGEAAGAAAAEPAGGPPPGPPEPPGAGPLALGGFAYDLGEAPRGPWAGFPTFLFRVPRLVVTRSRGRGFASGDLSLLELAPAYRAPAARRFSVRPVQDEARWGRAVAEAARRLRAGEAEKIVLARELVVRGDGAISAAAVARALRGAYPSCFTYLLPGGDGTAFVGASPELLVARRGRVATCQPMAGSIGRGRDADEDDRLAACLRASAKDGMEHRIAASHVARMLEPLSERVVRAEPEIVRFTNIQHLATTVRATLAEPPPALLELAAALHPTPAINGAPSDAARRLIGELEGMERGWYTGAVGWMDRRGDGELAVAIRCGLLWEDGARLYAGNGVMPDSEPAWELRETELKLEALLHALAG
jgi:isochorismate synthase